MLEFQVHQSFSGIFKEIAQIHEQNLNDPNNSVFTYKVTTFQASHSQGFTESLL